VGLVHLNLGAEIDIASGDELASGLAGIEDKLGRKPPRPTWLSFTGSRKGAGPITIGSAPVGRIWNVLTLTLVGNDDTTVVANARAALYVDSTEDQLTLANCRVPGLIVPSFQTFSKGTLWAHSDGALVLNVSGAVAATDQVVVSVSVAEWREGDIQDQSAGRY
jgi:hypothetical protein